MASNLAPPVRPRDGHLAQVLVICRVSDPREGKQDERSLGDQEAAYRKWLKDHLDLPFEVTVIAGSGSGELLDRAEYQQLIDLVATRRYDLALTEDLGRIVRRIHAHLVCEHCEDCDTRLIALNDRVDTAQPNWRECSIFAAFHHERANRDTSERIKRTHRNRFANGGCLPCEMYGWVKPAGAKHDGEMMKDPPAEEVYREWFRMLDEDDASFADIARWLDKRGVPVPPHARNRRWDSRMVGRHTYNPLLKGVRERNRRKTRRRNNPGKYVSRKADPADLLTRVVPHLAFFEEAYFDHVVAKVKDRNRRFRRTDNPADDPCLNRPKKDSRYPGRVTRCGICGRPFVWGGHGQSEHLMCTGAREYSCWNGVTFDGVRAAGRLVAAILEEIEQLPDFDPALLQLVAEEGRALNEVRENCISDLKRQLAEVETGIANIVRFVRNGNDTPSMTTELQRLEQERPRLVAKLKEQERPSCDAIEIPPIETIRAAVRDALTDLDWSDPDLTRVIRKLTPRIVVFPYRLCDGGGVVLRACFKLHVASLLSDRRVADVLRRPLERSVTVDLFDLPQREAFRHKVMAARAADRTERQTAEEFGLTVTATQRAAALQRTMDELGLIDAYVPVLQPPEDCPKLRRHKNESYRFDPLPGAGEL